jgi:hypothetical protein
MTWTPRFRHALPALNVAHAASRSTNFGLSAA